MRPAIIVLSASGLATARRVAAALGEAEIHGLAGRVDGAEVSFAQAAEHIAALFAEGRPVIGVCAAGILIRAVAPRLTDKRAEPPVIAVAEDGSAAVPLVGGHRGANRLARRIAEALGIAAAITTASDVVLGIALDDPPEGWMLANPEDAKEAMARLLAGVELRVEGELPWLGEAPQLAANCREGGIPEPGSPPARGRAGEVPAEDASAPSRRAARADLPLSGGGMEGGASAEVITLLATVRAEAGGAGRLVYHPRALAVGVGCERGCEPAELIALVDDTLAQSGLAGQAVALVASLDLKSDEPAVHALADHLGVPARFFDAARLAVEAPRLKNPSEAVAREVGCPGVAEGAALASVGADGTLIVEKTKSARGTCAIARAPAPIAAMAVGRARGRLSVVGLGPGDAAWRSPEATRLLSEASDWVGYGLYLDLAGDLGRGKAQHRFDLGQEEARVRHALGLAGEGRDVALVCSGDAGIYAMAALAFEVVEGLEAHDPARRAEIAVAPGISAFQAAAARAGALIGHDFCAISLSDLLTPWSVIEARVRAAAEGDFVVAFYNPRSRQRHGHLGRAIGILKERRPPETPVVVASNLGRADERVQVATLSDFDPEAVDMLTVVLVGASTSRAFRTGDGSAIAYTPRGYAAKRRAAE